jgi:hypothetical protein
MVIRHLPASPVRTDDGNEKQHHMYVLEAHLMFPSQSAEILKGFAFTDEHMKWKSRPSI